MKKRLQSLKIPRLVKITLIAVLFTTLLVAGIAYIYVFHRPWTNPNSDAPVEVNVVRGMNPKQIARLLHENGVIRSESTFLFGAKIWRATGKLQAGQYRFDVRTNNRMVLKKLVRGNVVTEKVLIPEGARASRIAHILKQNIQIDSTEFMALVQDTAFCRYLNINAESLEGYLYPDTYRFSQHITVTEVLRKLVSQFQDVFVDSLIKRSREIGLTMHEVVTLASIVEGEAAVAEERPIIAALYHNRLKRRMLLQADPTIQFIIPNGPRRLLNGDLEIDSPYNTYIHAGLPPGPVNNPGLASIVAVLYPTSDNYLYMVANGDGTHTFSRTMSQHLKAKARFDQVRRNVRRNR